MSERAVDRGLLPHTFGPWFGRFAALTEIQRLAIPVIAAGRDVLMCSATASGKTEAYAAPAAEIALAHGKENASIVIVTPTRALANDLKRRLEGPMNLVELSFGRYTGEHKERVAGRLPAVAVTTPEALDSLLARRAASLADVRVVVLDEIHVLDNTPRGDQLRILLHRLETLAKLRPQRVAASATVDRPEELAARYLHDPAVIVAPGIRGIRARAFDGHDVADMARHLDDLASHGFKKILVFCRSRTKVERLATKLVRRTRFGEQVYAHHGSMAKIARERTERLFQQAGAAVCIATLTLEMGIDIGTVDYVLLAGLPADVASVLQRIGRGSRRGDTTRAGFAAANAAEHHVHTTMLKLGAQGRLCGAPYGFRPSVVVQQALVTACASAWVEERGIEALLPPAVRAELGPGACRAILEALVEARLLERRGAGRFVPAEAIEERYERGTLHSNIDDEPGIEIVDRLTGDVLGTVAGASSRKIEIAGSEREIVRATGDRILTDRGRGSEPATFRPRGFPSVSLALARAVVEALGAERDAVPLVPFRGGFVLLHGLGTAGLALLTSLLQGELGASAIDAGTPYTLTLACALRDLPRPTATDCSRFLDGGIAALARLTQPGPWSHVLPRDLHARATRQVLGLDAVRAFLATARLVVLEDPSPELEAMLVDL